MFIKTSIAIAAASASVGFLAYCMYFDKKRRSDPDFKRKLREKRRQTSTISGEKSSTAKTNFPDPNNPESFHQFFLQEIQIGEELLATGQIDEGIEHLCNAVAVCGQPQQLLQLLQQTIPLQIFQLLIQRLPAVTMKFRGMSENQTSSVTFSEDVE